MKGIEKIEGLDENQVELLKASASQYLRLSNIHIEVIKVKSDIIFIQIEDKGKLENRSLSGKDLIKIALDMFLDCLPKGQRLHATPIPLNANFNHVTVEWIRKQLYKHKLKDNSLTKYLKVKDYNFVRLMSGQRQLTLWHQATIDYYFKILEKK